MEAWNGAIAASESGCDVRAVTAWALFGSFGWDSLVTRKPFSYEPGAFDVRSTPPRKTAISKAVRALATEQRFSHPAADPRGWWQPAEPIDGIPVDGHRSSTGHYATPLDRRRHAPLLITGAGGTLGRALARICSARGLPYLSLSRRELDVTDAIQTSGAIASLAPWAVINAAGYVRVDDAERERQECYRVNAEGAANLARFCAARGIPLVTFSTDLVFDGDHSSPYTEEDLVCPLNVYGESKAAAEAATLDAHPDALVVRTSAFFGPWDHSNFVIAALRTLADGAPFPAANDVSVSPTYVPDLAHAVLDLLIDGESGIWHLANRGEVTWAALAAEVAARARLDVELVRPVAVAELGRSARVPRYSVLGSSRASLLPTLDNALDRFFAEAPIPERQVVATW
jgi:dTDP-4-dehydrorhamnose reductase